MSGPLIKKFNGQDTISSGTFLKIFNKYDKDGNGFIEKNEIDHFAKDIIRQRLSKIQDVTELKKYILETYDTNKDGKISLSELAKLLPLEENYLIIIGKHQRMHVADFMKIWYHYDKDKNGYLETTELNGFLHDYLMKTLKDDERITPQMVEKESKTLVTAFDKNKDGKIELGELSKFLNVQENFLTQFKAHGDERLTEEEFENIFAHYDQDGNGYIEDVELLGFLKDLLQNKNRDPTTTDLEMYRSCILEISDSDKDGKLSKKELKLLLIK